MKKPAHIAEFIPREAEENIALLLSLDIPPRQAKSEIQRLCNYLEEGKHVRDSSYLTLSLIKLLQSKDVLVRRWSYKALGLLKRDDLALEPLIQFGPSEEDPENASWANNAIFQLAEEDKFDALIEDKILPNDGIAIWATKLFPSKKKPKNLKSPTTINLDRADPLTLKWMALLEGQGSLQSEWLHRKTPSSQIIPELNNHENVGVAEYSVFAMYKNKSYKPRQLGFKLDATQNKSENIRRWVYRLVMRDVQFLTRHLDWVKERTKDAAAPAREGLALGLKDVWSPDLSSTVIEWYQREPNQDIRDCLLEHMSANALSCPAYRETVITSYLGASATSVSRRRIEVAAYGTEFLQELKAEAIQRNRSPNLLDGQPGILIENLTITFVDGRTRTTMSNINIKNEGGNQTLGPIIGGDNFGDVRSAISASSLNENQQKAVGALIKALEEAPMKYREEVSEVVAATKKLSAAPSQDALSSVFGALEKLKQVGETASAWWPAIAAAGESLKDLF